MTDNIPFFYKYLTTLLLSHTVERRIDKATMKQVLAAYKIKKNMSNQIIMELEKMKLIEKISDKYGYRILFRPTLREE